MYRFYPEVIIKNNGFFIDIDSPWFIERVSNIHRNFFESRVFDYPIFHYIPREGLINVESKLGLKLDEANNLFPIFDRDRIKNLSLCSSNGCFDPLSIYTAVQHERLCLNLTNDKNHHYIKKLIDIATVDEQRLFSIIQQILVQSYYVTLNCIDALSPSRLFPGEVGEFMSNYIEEESGHHSLIWCSLEELGTEINNLIFSDEVIRNMELLKMLASNSQIGLACALGFFESASFQTSDPIADILIRSSKPGSSFGINTHFAINKKGNHGLVGFKLSQLIKHHISEEELDFVIETMEKIEFLSSTMIEQIFLSNDLK